MKFTILIGITFSVGAIAGTAVAVFIVLLIIIYVMIRMNNKINKNREMPAGSVTFFIDEENIRRDRHPHPRFLDRTFQRTNVPFCPLHLVSVQFSGMILRYCIDSPWTVITL